MSKSGAARLSLRLGDLMTRHEERPTDHEHDSRFPSGPWKGFFLQPTLSGRHWMELSLTFRNGVLTGDGRDWVGAFLFRGRYELDSGKCWWTKQYIGKHSIFYQGYNEGKGIWGTWEWSENQGWRGGFHIWPKAMGDPSQQRLVEEVEEPVTINAETLEPAEAVIAGWGHLRGVLTTS
jgi:hypothetical protein